MSAHNKLGIFMLAMLITGAVDSIRNLPATALFGPSLIFFFLLSSLLFLIPSALVSAQLAAMSGEKSGIYHWTRATMGDHAAFMAIWLQWFSNLVWFPTILSFIAASTAWLVAPALGQSPVWMIGSILVVFWAITLINLKGIQVSAWFASFCTVTGLIIPVTVIVVMAVAWIISGRPLQIHFSADTLIPDFSTSEHWVSLTAIMTAYIGVELAAVHGKDIKNPRKSFPLALLISMILILSTMITGALAIAIVLPQEKISLVNGVLQAFSNFFEVWHMSWAMPIMTIMIIVGSAGSIISWVISPARGLLQAGQEGYLPPFLARANKHGVASNLLILQAVIVSVFCMVFLLLPSVNGSYWFLTALSTQMYMLMYVFLFIGGIIAHYRLPKNPDGFAIPFGAAGMWFVCLTGLAGCALTEIIGFMPPSQINIGGIFRYELMFVSGMLTILLPVLFFWRYQSVKGKHLRKV